jgi:nucleotide-binding universal stress UspA family protein
LVQAARDEPDGLGSIDEERALKGKFDLPPDQRINQPEIERLVLIATVEELLRYEVVLKETTDQGAILVFPSEITREHVKPPDPPHIDLSFTFEGALGNVYATLAVRLARSRLFRKKAMWRQTALYTAVDGGGATMMLRVVDEASGELAVWFEAGTADSVRRHFEQYVLEHLCDRAAPGSVFAKQLARCPGCGYALPDDLLAIKRSRGLWRTSCPACEEQEIWIRADASAPVAQNDAVQEMRRAANQGRDEDVAATRLAGSRRAGTFDVFLCYNARDRQAVVDVAERLRSAGIQPWLDIWHVRPGTRWQRELDKQLRAVRAAAVFLGLSGRGPWQELEIEQMLQRFTRGRRPIIPVVLPGRKGHPRLPGFLELWQMVDMRRSDPDPIAQLIWGITGRPPVS